MKTIFQKTLLFATAIILANNVKVYAQATVATNSFVAGGFLGYGTTSGDLEFRVNNNTKMLLQNTTGNVGIGTSTPNEKLDVQSAVINDVIAGFGSAGNANYLYISNLNTLNAGYNVNGNSQIYINNVGYLNGATQFRDLYVNNGKGSTIAFFQGGSGNVGIGTTNPSNTLEIKGAANQLRLTSTGTEADIRYVPTSGHAWQVGVAPTAPNSFQFYEEGANISQLTIKEGGNVGLGTTTPINQLTLTKDLGIQCAANVNAHKLYASPSNTRTIRFDCSSTDSTGGWEFYNSNNSKSLMYVRQSGIVSIGTTYSNSAYKLAVGGKIIAEEVLVKLQSDIWPDYVFKKEYKMKTLNDLEKYVNTNNHLPGIPSANEVKKEGISIGEMQTKQMEKIEELTLYMLQMNKEIQNLKAENIELKTSLTKLKSN